MADLTFGSLETVTFEFPGKVYTVDIDLPPTLINRLRKWTYAFGMNSEEVSDDEIVEVMAKILKAEVPETKALGFAALVRMANFLLRKFNEVAFPETWLGRPLSSPSDQAPE